MALSSKDRSQRYRDRKKSGDEARRVGRPVEKGCGTPAGAKRHRRAGEDVCDLCADAEREYNRMKKAEKRARESR